MKTENSPPELNHAADAILAGIRTRMRNRSTPFLVVLDGGSGAGKSTLAARVAKALNASVIASDDFFAAEIPDAAWEAHTAEERARDAIDWRRLRREVLEPLMAGRPAKWHAFDFAAQRSDGTYPLRTDFEERQPAEVIILDGAYAARPELTDLIDFSVLIDVPVAVRHARLANREDALFLAGWHARWDAAETYYFSQIRPPSAFDLVVSP